MKACDEIKEFVTEWLKIVEDKIRECRNNQEIPHTFQDMDRELTNVITRLGD